MSADPKSPDFIAKYVNVRKIVPLPHMKMGGGLLPDTDEAAALWYFLLCATQALDRVPAQTTLEGQPDQVVHLRQLAESIQKMYNVKSLDMMFNDLLIFTARKEALRCKLPWNPKLTTWFESGGKIGNIIDRDPDKVGQA